MEHLLGFIFSWVIGLTPAFIYRYGIYGKPIKAKKVFWRLAPIVAVLCIVFKATVAKLNEGEYNPNPLPWFFIYWVGQWIMTRSKASNLKNPLEDSVKSVDVDIPLVDSERDPVVNEVLADIPFEIEECVLFDNEMEEEMAAINLSDKFDEQFYEIAQKEFDAGDIAKGLMLKAEVAAGGDAGKARLLYIKTRAQKLAGEEKSLAGLREALAGAAKNEKSAGMVLKRIKQFRADYPDNSKIDELQAEWEYQCLEERITKETEYYAPLQRCKKYLQMCDSFLEEHPGHQKRHEIEQNKAKYEGELPKLRDQNVFSITQIDAQELIRKRKYQEASDLYKKYLEQYSEHADKARKMIDETIPKLIADEPARKRRVKRNCVLGAAILAGLVVIIGFSVVKAEQEARIHKEKSEQEARIHKEKNEHKARLLREKNEHEASLLREKNEHEARLSAELYKAGLEQKKAGEYAEALKSFQDASALGNMPAKYEIGLLYLEGDGVTQHFFEAEKWLRNAAFGGDKEASDKLLELFSLGKIAAESNAEEKTFHKLLAEKGNADSQYWLGENSYKGYTGTTEWYFKAANQGHKEAQNKLAETYYKEAQRKQSSKYFQNTEVERDYVEAGKWYLKAAEQGQVDAQLSIAEMYKAGRGVKRLDKDAAKWYLKAALQGNLKAQEELIDIYMYGKGVLEDRNDACAWAEIAYENGSKHAGVYRKLGNAAVVNARAEELKSQIKKGSYLDP